MKPAPEADRRTLIRRLSIDLTGLPPAPEEVEAFVQDKSKDAYEKLVDRLLGSRRYGERWARHWLDVARYADSMGYAAGGVERRFPYSYTYRDYVIRAFNEDLPYNQFIKEQLAADFLVKDDKRPLAALGFLTLGRHFLGNIHDKIDDRIDVVTRGLMGVTAQCARCHDHKFDPVTTRDYYGLYGVFASSTEPMDKPLLGIPPDPEEHEAYLAERRKREADLEKYRADEVAKALADIRKRTGEYLLALHDSSLIKDRRQAVKLIQSRKLEEVVVGRWKTYLEAGAKTHNPVFAPWMAFAALEEKDFAAKAGPMAASFALNKEADKLLHPAVVKLFEGKPPESLKDVSERYGKLFATIEEDWQKQLKSSADAKSLTDADAERLRQVLYAEDSPANVPVGQHDELLEGARPKLRELQAKITRLDATHAGAPARAMAMVDGSPRNARIFIRGQPGNNGPEAPRKFIEVLSKSDAPVFSNGSGRLELAEAIASKDNPLTARVLVNRVWLHHFGEAFVRSTSDFGIRTERPVHAELLDWLSWQFMEQGWSLKNLHRLILTSSAYRMSTEADPRKAQGYALRDPNNALFWKQSRQRLDLEALRDSLLFVAGKLDETPASQPVELWDAPYPVKRSVYGFIDRQNLPGVFQAFDFANPDTSSPRRLNTTVPQQALFMMNNDFVVQQAKQLASLPAVQETGSDESRLRALYQIVLQRDPAKEEAKMALAYLNGAVSAEPPPEPPVWRYGHGSLDETGGRVAGFQEFPRFEDGTWKGGSKLPDPKLGWVSLHARGGHTGDNPNFMAIRRWVAPRDGIVSIDGVLEHAQSQGDGVRGRVVSSRSGVMADAKAHNGSGVFKVARLGVIKGDTIDFVVDCNKDTSHDSFLFPVTLTYLDAKEGEKRTWSSEKDFSGPGSKQPAQLKPWEKFAQVLLLSNEFMFVD